MFSRVRVSSSRSKLFMVGGGAALLLLAGVAGFFFWKYQSLSDSTKEARAGKEESKRILETVGKIYKLPADEEPTVAQVQDKSKLAEQEFFKNAENGDYVLVYSKNAKLALLYRQSEGRLINVGPVSVSDQAGEAAGASTKKE